jgi:threonine dehydrogenase-like Zn-dependent dehydrogenase
MRALVTNFSTPRYLFTAAAQQLPRGLGKSAGWGPGGMLSLVKDFPEPSLPAAPGWVRVRPELSGICGSDIGLLHGHISLVLTAFGSAPTMIFGHETVGVVDEVGPGVTAVSAGDRVAVNPIISCAQRGHDPVCRACADGYPGVCERFDQPGISNCQSMSLGFDSNVGGGWGESLVAHESMLYKVDKMPSKRAVLAEPASITLHAALRWQRRGDRVVVIGPGTIGQLLVANLRMLHPDLDIIVLSPDDFGSAKAMEAGASRILPSGAQAIESLADSDGGRVLRPRMTKTPILEQGVDAVFDCVGSADTIDLGLHLLRSTGSFVLIGAAGKQPMDWSLVWNRRINVHGTYNFGPEPSLPSGQHTMAQVVEWLGDPKYRVDGIVTSVYDMEKWQKAIETASAGPRARSVKATLRPNPEIPLVD